MARLKRKKLQIAGSGGSPGQPYTPPKEDPKNPWVPAPDKTKLAHGEFFDDDGRITKQDPSVGLTPSGKKIKMKVDKKKQKKNKAKHDRLYHGSK
jgi:hypothetical protein